MQESFLDCSDIRPFCDDSPNSDVSWIQGCFKNEVTLGFNMALGNCKKCAGVSFVFNEGCVPKDLTLYFEYDPDSPFTLSIELKDKMGRTYKNFKILGRENLPLSGIVRDCTSEISIICSKNENEGKKGEVRIYL